ncbi:LOW QUALITY PROTEIN: relA-associated inhibitor [Apteryx mantelli]|uniref:LOW QUALITY PROTEIN: relA-associated inhibitor n=1 Tax=Apteryx mantelli TaxID=2696672 RepID=A0ABM4FZX3_9AVES
MDRTVASQQIQNAQDLLDLTFQSLAMKHMDLKQVELDTAVAKVDELSRQLESLWTDGPGPPAAQPKEPYSPLGHSEPHQLAFRPEKACYDLVIKRRRRRAGTSPTWTWAYEKKPSSSGGYDRASEGQLGLRQPLGLQLAPWRESSLDGAGGQGKDAPYGMHSATLPRNYKVSPLASERRPEGAGRRAGHPGTLPRAWHPALQPASRIPMPPPSPQGARPPRHKPLPLSMIFKLQNAFWEHGAAAGGPRGLPPGPLAFPRSPQKPPQLQAPPAAQAPPAPPPGEGPGRAGPPEAAAGPPEATPEAARGPPEAEPEPELETLLLQGAEAEEVARPLSPTRLQPLLPPEAQKVPEFEEVARVLAEMPRPLKRRGSMEQSPGPALPPTHKKQYQQLITRLFHHRPRKDEPAAPEPPPELPPGAETAPEAKAAAAVAVPPAAPRQSPPPSLLAFPEPPGSPLPSPERRSALRSPSSPRKRPKGRVRLNPLVLLLDAALTGELDVVQQAVAELNDPSQPNDEGITALHNAICGANYAIVDFLIASGADVNSPDSHGWTPLHCAASCNDTAVCVALVRHGAAIFATTASDGSLAVEKCDPYREGYADCYNYLCEVEQSMGTLNSGVVYALWDYSAELGDELSFREGEPVTVLRRAPPEQLDWWWGSLYGHEGYVPKNYFGLFPRVRPQRKKV